VLNFFDPLTKNSKTAKETNTLHSFSSYNCLFTLSGLTETEIRNPEDLFNNPVHDVIARSSGIGNSTSFSNEGTSIGKFIGPETTATIKKNKTIYSNADKANTVLKRNHDIFFEEVVVTSVHTPNEEKSLMNFTKMEFELHEPFGSTLIEKCRAAAFNCGYIDHQDAPFLLTIEWKGYDSNGNPVLSKDLIRKIPISLNRVEFDLDAGGSKYNVIAVAYSEQAGYSRFLYTRTANPNISGNNMEEFCNNLQNHLNSKMSNEIANQQRQYADIYDIKISSDFTKEQKQFPLKRIEDLHVVGSAGDDAGEFALPDSYDKKNSTTIRYEGYKQAVAANTAIHKILEDAMKNVDFFKKKVTDFLEDFKKNNIAGDTAETYDDLLSNNQYVKWFKIKTTVHTETLLTDKITKMHPKHLLYRIEPYDVHILKFVKPGVNFGNVPWASAVKKEYNYIYTGDNVDIQNLRIHYKAAWYQNNLSDVQNTSGTDPKNTDQTQQNIVGNTRPNDLQKSLDVRGYPSTSKTATDTYRANAPMDNFMYYLTNPMTDMVRVEMDILGDPAYIAQDAFLTYNESAKGSDDTSGWVKLVNGDANRTTWSRKFSCFNYDMSMPIVSLKYRLPTDFDENTGMFFSQGNLDQNLTFSGIYEVARVESRINKGSFTQKLIMTRLNNQDGDRQIPLTPIKNYNESVDTPVPGTAGSEGQETYLED
jgi:hypothetical protein